MITIAELKPTVFTELQKLKPHIKLFTVIADGSELDNMYIFSYGDRIVPDDNVDSATVAKYMGFLYADSWDSAYYLFQNTQNIIPDLGQFNKTTVTHNYRYTDTIKDVDSLPAFDDKTLQTNNQNDRTFTHDEYFESPNKNEKVTTVEKKDINDFQMSYKFLLLNWVHDIIFNDLNRYLTLYVHN